MLEIIKKIINFIINTFFKKLNLNKLVNKNNNDVKNENNILNNTGFEYENDPLFQAKSFSNSLFEKNMAVIHFSWTRNLNILTNYFSKQIPPNTANSTWGIGKEGTVHRYLPDIRMPSWTNNAIWNNKGVYAKFTDLKGKWQSGRYVNNYSCAFEIVNINYEPYTDSQYSEVAKRLKMMLDIFRDFRIWRITGHSYLTPIAKDDPGIQWNWRRLLVGYVGVSKDFYEEYLKYLEETAYSTVGDTTRTALKWQLIKQGVEKLNSLIDKPKNYGFK